MSQPTVDYAADFAALVESRLAGTITAGAFTTSLSTLLVDQYGTGILTNQLLAAQISTFIEEWRLDRAQFRNFLTIPVNGGTAGDGEVTMTDGAGGTFPSPGLEKLKTLMAKGDNAATDMSFYFGGNFAGSELLCSYQATVPSTYDVTKCLASCDGAPASTKVITITKDGAAWGTVTFAPGSYVGVVAIPTPTQAVGQKLKFIAPATHDPAFTNVNITIAGAL